MEMCCVVQFCLVEQGPNAISEVVALKWTVAKCQDKLCMYTYIPVEHTQKNNWNSISEVVPALGNSQLLLQTDN